MTNRVSILGTRADRIAVTCGMVSQYNISDPDKKYGVKNLGNVVSKRLKMQGFIVFDPDFGPKYAKDHQKSKSSLAQDALFRTGSYFRDVFREALLSCLS